MRLQAQILLFFTVLIAFFYGAAPQIFSLGPCPSIQGVDHMNYDKLKGIWYQYAKTAPLTGDDPRCVTHVMGTPVKGEKPIETLQIDKFLFWDVEHGNTEESSIKGEGRLRTIQYNSTYLNDDYDEYVVVYACQNYELAKQEMTWILTRERFPTCEVILKAYDKIWEYDLKVDPLRMTNQTDCPDSWDENTGLFKFRG